MERARRTRTGAAMITRFETLLPTATVDEAADALLRTTQREFPVVGADGRFEGFLTRDAMIAALKATGPKTPVSEAMQRDIPVVRPTDWLEAALRIMQERSADLVAVADPVGRLVGYVSQENIAELMMLEAADWPGGRRGAVAIGPTGPRPG
jgi:stage IV sporulation protein FB